MNNADFWDVAPCTSCVADVPEELNAFIFRVEKSASEESA
jgi:hypothetical protein